MKKITTLIASVLLMFSFSSLKAEVNYGVSVMTGLASSSGTEFEDGAGSADKNSEDIDEVFAGASVFVETEYAGITVGLDIIPFGVELGSKSRTDSTTDSNESTDDSGTYTASADLENLITLYANYPIGSAGAYLLGGIHHVTIATNETLPSSSYGDEDIFGYQVGIGVKEGNYKFEVFYSDFEDISISATGGSATHVIEADADAFGVKISYLF